MAPRACVALCCAAIALALVSGCDIQGRVVILPDDSVTVDATVWDTIEVGTLPEDEGGAGEAVPFGPCDVYPPAAGLSAERLTDPSDPTHQGCHFTGTTTLNALREGQGGSVLVRTDDRVVVFVPPRSFQSAAGQDQSGRPRTDRPFDVTITFPGQVVAHDASSSLDGTTVRWTSTPVETGMWASALRGEASPPIPWVPLVGVGGFFVGAAAAAVASVGRSRRRADAAASDLDRPIPLQPAPGDDGRPAEGCAESNPTVSAPTVSALESTDRPDASGADPSVWAPDADR